MREAILGNIRPINTCKKHRKKRQNRVCVEGSQRNAVFGVVFRGFGAFSTSFWTFFRAKRRFPSLFFGLFSCFFRMLIDLPSTFFRKTILLFHPFYSSSANSFGRDSSVPNFSKKRLVSFSGNVYLCSAIEGLLRIIIIHYK